MVGWEQNPWGTADSDKAMVSSNTGHCAALETINLAE
jgi:hypothetical protein